MYNLLIVDDERYILDSYYEMLSEHFGNILNIDKYNSSSEVMSHLNNRIDILVVDIFMPVIDGFELQEHIRQIWSKCRIIFLTGDNGVKQAQKAMRFGSNVVDYVLKIEDDGVLIKAISKAIDSIKNEIKSNELMLTVQKNMQLAMPLLAREFILSLLYTPAVHLKHIGSRFSQYNLAFDEFCPVIVLCALIKEKNSSHLFANPSYLNTMFFAVDDILKVYLEHIFYSYGMVYEKDKMVWLFQPHEKGQTQSSNDYVNQIYSFLDIIQDSCERMLNATVNFVMSRHACDWDNLHKAFMQINTAADRFIFLTDCILFIEDIQAEETLQGETTENNELALEQIRNALIQSDMSSYISSIQSIVLSMKSRPDHYAKYYFEICSCFIECMKAMKIPTATYNEICGLLIRECNTAQSLDCLTNTLTQAAQVFMQVSSESEDKITGVIKTVLDFIDANIEGDLSLTLVSAMVYHSPTYFSKMFKRVMGVNYSEYVMKQRMIRAKNLLVETSNRINSIAALVGFDSVSYFVRTFKKTYGDSPSEFRHKNRS